MRIDLTGRGKGATIFEGEELRLVEVIPKLEVSMQSIATESEESIENANFGNDSVYKSEIIEMWNKSKISNRCKLRKLPISH